MAKGKANPALTIWICREYGDRPEIAELRAAGHTVIEMDETPPADLILHPAAHKWNDAMWESPYLKAALSDARKLHRGRKKK